MINLTELELDNLELDSDTLVRLQIASDDPRVIGKRINSIGTYTLFECRYATIQRTAKALGIPAKSKQHILTAKIINIIKDLPGCK